MFLKEVSKEVYRNLKFPNHFTEGNQFTTALPEGSYFLMVGDSGCEMVGKAQVINKVLYWSGLLGTYGKLPQLKRGGWEVDPRLPQLTKDFSFLGVDFSLNCLSYGVVLNLKNEELSIMYSYSRKSLVFYSGEEQAKAFFVEKEISLFTLEQLLAEMGEFLNYKTCLMCYNPTLGFYLPGED